MGIVEDIETKILNDSLFDSMLAELVREHNMDTSSELYTLLAHDEQTRKEIAHEAVAYCGRYVADKKTWLRNINRDALLGNHLKTIFEGLKMLCEVEMDGPLPSAKGAWHQWKLLNDGRTDVNVGNMRRLLGELALVGRG